MQTRSRDKKKATKKPLKKETKRMLTTKITKKNLRKFARGRLARSTAGGNQIPSMDGSKQKIFQYFSAVDWQNFKCSICFELLLTPFSLHCGHIFCFGCLDDLSQHDTINNFCPCCRLPIDNAYPVKCHMLEGIMNCFVRDRLSEEEKIVYEGRNQKIVKLFKERAEEYRNVQVGSKIDIKIGNHWEVGVVRYLQENGEKSKIEVMIPDSLEVYIFPQGSSHLARYHTFTNEMRVSYEDVIEGYRLQGLGALFNEQLNNLRRDVSFMREGVDNLGEEVSQLRSQLRISIMDDGVFGRVNEREDWVNEDAEVLQNFRNQNLSFSVQFYNEENMENVRHDDEAEQHE